MVTRTTPAPTRLPAGRKAELVSYLSEAEQVTVNQLAERFDVSRDTVRRDLHQLHKEGLVVRTHGGAVSVNAVAAAEKKLDVRMRQHPTEKDQIGALAATLVSDNSVLMLNAGTTTLSVVRHLSERRDLTIATNNLRIAAEISPNTVRDIYVFGGSVRLGGQATIGPVSLQFPGGRDLQLRCDLALISVGAVSARDGYSTSNLAEAIMMGEMMERAAKVAILADSSKFTQPLFAQIAELDHADYLVTDAKPPADLAHALKQAHVDVLIARAATHIETA
ncbi:MAG: transcriptional regulator [Candidatus Lumbricidophila eiseniae]|uniref:Transcriptional regulator n=1 Tax=Candidatus Lumbricidiphila eiseniae TaxID=1969409 RepID=A0A2A6FPI5_9MICO|nr:MAG: transcriptional regulator [Candidatus Lumbricidophila eiseniae]